MSVSAWRMTILPFLLLISYLVISMMIWHKWGNASALWLPKFSELSQFITLHSTLACAVLAGIGLGIASSIIMQMTQNPLASDTTLPVASGAFFGKVIAVMTGGGGFLAFIGAYLAQMLVFVFAKNQTAMLLFGLVINVLIGALVSAFVLFFPEKMSMVAFWQAGSLLRADPSTPMILGVVMALALLVLLPLSRALNMLSLGDDTARALGVNVARTRLFGMAWVALVVSAVVSAVGLIGFLGLFATHAADRWVKSSHFIARAFGGAFLGALFLLWVQGAVFWADKWTLSAGALCALLGAPWLIYLAFKLPLTSARADLIPKISRVPWLMIGVVFLVVLILALSYSPVLSGGNGWVWRMNWQNLDYRAARTISALGAGLLLGGAGAMLQRTSGNAMASPEVLGVSAAAALGVLLSYLLTKDTPSVLMMLLSGAMGALVLMVFLAWASKRVGQSALLLIGVGVSAWVSSVLLIVKLSGDMRLGVVLGWLSGSTYYANMTSAAYLLGASVILGVLCLCSARVVDALSLDEMAQNIGVRIGFARLWVLLLVALMSAVATLFVGPLSFIGLIAPHGAYLMGARRAGALMALSMIIGGALMVLADYLGRYVLFPYEIPAGLIASMLGSAYFAYVFFRSAKSAGFFE